VKCHATESTYSKNSSVIPKKFTIYRSWARKNTNLVENLKEINWWFDTLMNLHILILILLNGHNISCPQQQLDTEALSQSETFMEVH
jgi:hypothetical protein